MSQCVDPLVGKILAGWRYDISGLAPEMRQDYEDHFAGCEHCRSRVADLKSASRKRQSIAFRCESGTGEGAIPADGGCALYALAFSTLLSSQVTDAHL